MKKLELSGKKGRGLFVLIDDEDFEKVNKWKWQLSNRGYASRPQWIKPRKLNKQTTIYLHRLILSFPDLEVDHINMNKLDNRKENLRLVNDLESSYHRGKHKDNRSGYKGVSFHEQKWRKKKWRAQIKINGKNINIGYFDNPIEAARTYDKVAKENFGKFAYLNFP